MTRVDKDRDISLYLTVYNFLILLQKNYTSDIVSFVLHQVFFEAYVNLAK